MARHIGRRFSEGSAHASQFVRSVRRSMSLGTAPPADRRHERHFLSVSDGNRDAAPTAERLSASDGFPPRRGRNDYSGRSFLVSGSPCCSGASDYSAPSFASSAAPPRRRRTPIALRPRLSLRRTLSADDSSYGPEGSRSDDDYMYGPDSRRSDESSCYCNAAGARSTATSWRSERTLSQSRGESRPPSELVDSFLAAERGADSKDVTYDLGIIRRLAAQAGAGRAPDSEPLRGTVSLGITRSTFATNVTTGRTPPPTPGTPPLTPGPLDDSQGRTGTFF